MWYKVLIQAIDDVINFKVFLQSSSKAAGDRGKERVRWKNKNLNILRMRKDFLQNIFQNFFIW